MSIAIPPRFSGARFFDNTALRYREVECRAADSWLADENTVRQSVQPSGIYLAAEGATQLGKRRRAPRRSDADESSEDDLSQERALERETRRDMNFSQREIAEMRKRVDARVLKSPPAPAAPANYVHLTEERSWDVDQVLLVEAIAAQVAPVAACVTTVKNLVMRDGLKFMRANIELVPSNEFSDFVKRRLHPFAFQVMEALLLTGIVPIAYEFEPRSGQRWPYVPALGTYVIKQHTVRGAKRYRFYWIDDRQYAAAWRRQAVRVRDSTNAMVWRARVEVDSSMRTHDAVDGGGIYDPNVEIVHNLGHDLTSDGKLTSKVASLVQMAKTRLAEQRARTTAVSNSAAPPIITQYNHAAEQSASSAMSTGYYTGAAVADDTDEAQAARIENATYTRDAAQRQVFAGMLRQFEAATGRSAADEFGVRPEEYRADMGGTAVVKPSARNADGVLAPHANQYHVSSARQLANGPQARVATDYVNVLAQMDVEVFTAFGLPEDYMRGTTSARAGTDVVQQRLNDELETYKSRVSDILTHVYNSLFLDEDITRYLDSHARRARTTAPGDSAGEPFISNLDLFVAEALKRVRVTFAKKATESTDTLFQAFAIGAIDQQAVCAELARLAHFDTAQICANEKLLSAEARMMFSPQLAEYVKMQHAAKMQREQLRAQAAQQKQQSKPASQSAAAAETGAQKPGAASGDETPEKRAEGAAERRSPAKRARTNESSKEAAPRETEKKKARDAKKKDAPKEKAKRGGSSATGARAQKK